MPQVEELIGAARIAERVRELARDIATAFPSHDDPPLLMLVLLKGAFVFAADLVRALAAHGVHPEVDFLRASSYGGGTESRGVVEVHGTPELGLAGREVLLVDDILDTGRSLAHVRDLLRTQGARRVLTCVLLDKPSRRVVDVRADFVGFEIPNRFVVGYGVDWAERYRHLPYVGVVEGL